MEIIKALSKKAPARWQFKFRGLWTQNDQIKMQDLMSPAFLLLFGPNESVVFEPFRQSGFIHFLFR